MSIFGLLADILKLCGEFWLANPITGTVLFIYLFYALFLMCAGIYVGWRKFPLWVRALVLPMAAVMLLVDILVNCTLACLLFWAIPPAGCYTVTERISFYKNTMPNTWRGRFGRFICQNLLDPAQVGGHCS